MLTSVQDILRFLHGLRALLRRHPQACASVSLAAEWSGDPAGSGWHQKIGWVSDGAITMDAFTGASPVQLRPLSNNPTRTSQPRPRRRLPGTPRPPAHPHPPCAGHARRRVGPLLGPARDGHGRGRRGEQPRVQVHAEEAGVRDGAFGCGGRGGGAQDECAAQCGHGACAAAAASGGGGGDRARGCSCGRACSGGASEEESQASGIPERST